MMNEKYEMSSFEVKIKNDTPYFHNAWNECKQPLYRHANNYMKQKQKPLTNRVGCEFTIYKIKDNMDEMVDFSTTSVEEVKIKEIVEQTYFGYLKGEFTHDLTCTCLDLNVSTKHMSIYTSEEMKKAILPPDYDTESQIEHELYKKMLDVIDKVKGSEWTIYRFNLFYYIVYK